MSIRATKDKSIGQAEVTKWDEDLASVRIRVAP
jgi:hypothetical protein